MIKFWYPRTIWLFAVSIGLILLSVGLFRFYMPNNAEAELYEKNAEELRTQAGKAPQAEKKIVNANKLIKEAEVRWQGYVATKTPPTEVSEGGINLNVNAWQLLIDTKRYRNNLQRAINKQVISGGVKVITGPYVPGVNDSDPANGVLASYYNYPAIPFPVVIHDLGQVTVQGTYDQIMENVKSWAKMPRYLAVADGLALSGTAPLLTATYNVSIVGYIKETGIFPAVPEGTASAPSGGGGLGGGSFGPPAGGGMGGPAFGAQSAAGAPGGGGNRTKPRPGGANMGG